MKLSKETATILKNFVGINQSIVLQEGSIIRTASNAKHIYGTFDCEELFPVNVPLYDLNNFLTSLSLFDDANIEFTENYALIEGNSSNMKYTYNDEGMVQEVDPFPEDAFVNPRVTFDFTAENIQSILKAANVIESNVITITKNEESQVTVTAHSNINVDAKSYEILTDVSSDTDFSVVMKIANLKMVPADYTVQLFERFALFKSDKLTYVIVTEHESTWG